MHSSSFGVASAADKKSKAGGAKAGGAAAGAFKGKYPMGGSTTTEPVFTSAIEASSIMNPGAKLSYDSQGSIVGVTGVIDGNRHSQHAAGGPHHGHDRLLPRGGDHRGGTYPRTFFKTKG